MVNEHQFKGIFGFIILPDEKTVQEASQLAKTRLPQNAEYILSSGAVPHITLYHADFKALPVDEVRRLLTALNSNLKGTSLILERITLFKNFFLFWHTSDESTKILRECHLAALEISRFRDVQNQKDDVFKDRIPLNSKELNNVHRYGHPWIGDMFCPHITLGYGSDSVSAQGPHHRWELTVETVAFARIDAPARIEKIVDI